MNGFYHRLCWIYSKIEDMNIYSIRFQKKKNIHYFRECGWCVDASNATKPSFSVPFSVHFYPSTNLAHVIFHLHKCSIHSKQMQWKICVFSWIGFIRQKNSESVSFVSEHFSTLCVSLFCWVSIICCCREVRIQPRNME